MSLGISGVRTRQRRRSTVLEQRFLNPGKGLNIYTSEEFIDDKESSYSMNTTIVESGGISKRYGWETVGTGLTQAPRGLGSYYPTGANPMLITIDGTNLKYLANTLWTTIPGVNFSISDRVSMLQAAGKFFIYNGVDAIARLTNAMVLDRPNTTVSAGFGIYYADRQFAAGVKLMPNRLYVSSAADVADFTNATDNATTAPGSTTPWAGTDAKFYDVAADDGDTITALAKYQDQLIIFKSRSIYSFTFDSTGNGTIKLVTNAMGCISHWSIDSVDNDMIFLSRLGYYVLGTQAQYFDQIRTNQLSTRIQPYIDAITPANLSRATGIWYNNIYYCAVPFGNSTKNNRCFTYHRQYTAWGQSNNINANAFTEFIDTNNNINLYYADENTATVYRQTRSYTDNGVAIPMIWAGKAHDFNTFDITKRFVDVTLLFRQLSGSVTVNVYIDGNRQTIPFVIPGVAQSGGMGRSAFGRSVMGGTQEASTTTDTTTSTTNIPIRLNVGADGRMIKIEVSNNNAGENFVLLGYAIGYRPSGRNNFPPELRVYS